MAGRVTVLHKAVAVNLYHTSSSGVPTAQSTGMPALAVAAQTVPEELVVPGVSVTVPTQLSFAGWANAVFRLPENTIKNRINATWTLIRNMVYQDLDQQDINDR